MGAFMYLDPPYDIKDNLYGHKGSMHKTFDHDKFAADCDANNMDQLVSYNSDQLVKDRFKNWNAAEFDLTYTMRSVGEYTPAPVSVADLAIPMVIGVPYALPKESVEGASVVVPYPISCANTVGAG